MKKNTFEKATNQELLKKRNVLKGVLIGFSIIYTLIFALIIFLFVTDQLKSRSFVSFIPLFILPVTLAPLLIYLGMLNTEIKSRQL